MTVNFYSYLFTFDICLDLIFVYIWYLFVYIRVCLLIFEYLRTTQCFILTLIFPLEFQLLTFILNSHFIIYQLLFITHHLPSFLDTHHLFSSLITITILIIIDHLIFYDWHSNFIIDIHILWFIFRCYSTSSFLFITLCSYSQDYMIFILLHLFPSHNILFLSSYVIHLVLLSLHHLISFISFCFIYFIIYHLFHIAPQ